MSCWKRKINNGSFFLMYQWVSDCESVTVSQWLCDSDRLTLQPKELNGIQPITILPFIPMFSFCDKSEYPLRSVINEWRQSMKFLPCSFCIRRHFIGLFRPNGTSLSVIFSTVRFLSIYWCVSLRQRMKICIHPPLALWIIQLAM